DEALDFEAVRAQEIDPVAVTKLELDFARVGPLDLAQPELRSDELLAHTVHGHAERADDRIAEEDQAPARSEQSRRLRNPAIRVGPERGSVLGVDDVERRIGKRHVLADRFDQWKLDPGLLL